MRNSTVAQAAKKKTFFTSLPGVAGAEKKLSQKHS